MPNLFNIVEQFHFCLKYLGNIQIFWKHQTLKYIKYLEGILRFILGPLGNLLPSRYILKKTDHGSLNKQKDDTSFSTTWSTVSIKVYDVRIIVFYQSIKLTCVDTFYSWHWNSFIFHKCIKILQFFKYLQIYFEFDFVKISVHLLIWKSIKSFQLFMKRFNPLK